MSRKVKTIVTIRKLRKRSFRFHIYHLLMLCVMAGIFYFSSQNGESSRAVSGGVLKLILSVFSGILPQVFLTFLEQWIRKVAHFVFYCLLGFLASMAMWNRSRRNLFGRVDETLIKSKIPPEDAGDESREPESLQAAYSSGDRAQPADDPGFPPVSLLLSGWLIATGYAASDEIHQLFVPERAGMFRDVLLDSSGAALGTLIAFGVCLLEWKLAERPAKRD